MTAKSTPKCATPLCVTSHVPCAAREGSSARFVRVPPFPRDSVTVASKTAASFIRDFGPMSGTSSSLKKLKKAAKQRAAAEANATRAEAFMAEKEGRPAVVVVDKKRKAQDGDDGDDGGDTTNDQLELALRSGAAAAEKKADAKKAKKNKSTKSSNEATGEQSEGGTSLTLPLPAAVAQFREEHQIKVVEGTPDPIIEFHHAPFPKKLIAALLKQGYKTPSPIQAQVRIGPFPNPGTLFAHTRTRRAHYLCPITLTVYVYTLRETDTLFYSSQGVAVGASREGHRGGGKNGKW